MRNKRYAAGSIPFSLDGLKLKILEMPVDLRGFFLSALLVMHDTGEPLPADSNIARMRIGIFDIRVYRRLVSASVDAGLLFVKDDGSVSAAIFERNRERWAKEFEARSAAAQEREDRYRDVRRADRRVRQAVKEPTREDVWRKTSGKCVYCGVGLTTLADQPNSFRVDHVLPVARGGTEDIGNLVPSCFTCNAKKSDKTVLRFLDQRGDVL